MLRLLRVTSSICFILFAAAAAAHGSIVQRSGGGTERVFPAPEVRSLLRKLQLWVALNCRQQR